MMNITDNLRLWYILVITITLIALCWMSLFYHNITCIAWMYELYELNQIWWHSLRRTRINSIRHASLVFKKLTFMDRTSSSYIACYWTYDRTVQFPERPVEGKIDIYRSTTKHNQSRKCTYWLECIVMNLNVFHLSPRNHIFSHQDGSRLIQLSHM